ncbi:cobalt transporter CbiM [Calidifontibacillus oryziterrae]|uniref:cobalt transporter CbiM n=1 Tax=Calidifontibacillus oryziterrae TaxID=1191699 RepID=UPI00031C8C04|nr:cobalt transporter CbiM [Calidifontibacillus oryziterrae]
MHIPEGMLPGTICAVGYGLTGITLWYSLKKIKQKDDPRREIPKASMLTAAFFISTFILIPIPPTSVHPLLIGLIGAILGFYAFPALLIALFFQAALFQHGGITTLGVNAFLFGTSALLSYSIYQLLTRVLIGKRYQVFVASFLTGAAGVAITVILFYFVLITFIPANLDVVMEQQAISILTIAHIPIMLVEGIFTGFLFTFLKKVKPELIDGIH